MNEIPSHERQSEHTPREGGADEEQKKSVRGVAAPRLVRCSSLLEAADHLPDWKIEKHGDVVRATIEGNCYAEVAWIKDGVVTPATLRAISKMVEMHGDDSSQSQATPTPNTPYPRG